MRLLLAVLLLSLTLGAWADGMMLSRNYLPRVQETDQLAVIDLARDGATVDMFIAIDGIPAGTTVTYVLPFWHKPEGFTLEAMSAHDFRTRQMNTTVKRLAWEKSRASHPVSTAMLWAIGTTGALLFGPFASLLAPRPQADFLGPQHGMAGASWSARATFSPHALFPYATASAPQARAELYHVETADLQTLVAQAGLPEQYAAVLRRYRTQYYAIMRLTGLPRHAPVTTDTQTTPGMPYPGKRVIPEVSRGGSPRVANVRGTFGMPYPGQRFMPNTFRRSYPREQRDDLRKRFIDASRMNDSAAAGVPDASGIHYHFRHPMAASDAYTYTYPLGTGGAWPQPILLTEVYVSCAPEYSLHVNAPQIGKPAEYTELQRMAYRLREPSSAPAVVPLTGSELADPSPHPSAWHRAYLQSNPNADIVVQFARRQAGWLPRTLIAFSRHEQTFQLLALLALLASCLLAVRYVLRPRCRKIGRAIGPHYYLTLLVVLLTSALCWLMFFLFQGMQSAAMYNLWGIYPFLGLVVVGLHALLISIGRERGQRLGGVVSSAGHAAVVQRILCLPQYAVRHYAHFSAARTRFNQGVIAGVSPRLFHPLVAPVAFSR